MNAPVITAVAAWVPESMPLSQWSATEATLRARGQPGWNAWVRSWQPDSGFWIQAGADAQAGRSPVAAAGLPMPGPACAVPVETGISLSGLAAGVADMIRTSRPAHARPVDAIIFCHSSPEEHVPATVAGRLCAGTGTPCFPFSISQQHGASPFTALRLASDLLAAESDLHTILIVAAEKWSPPFSRACAPGIVQGDAAGALLVERGDFPRTGMELLDARVRHIGADSAGRPDDSTGARTSALLPIISFLLARHRLCHHDITDVAGHPGCASLTAAVCAQLGRPHADAQPAQCVHLGAAQSIVSLCALTTHRASNYPTRHLLMWGYGTGGFAGAALIRMRGLSFQDPQDRGRHVPHAW